MTDLEFKAIMDREAKAAIAQAKAMQAIFDSFFKAEPLTKPDNKTIPGMSREILFYDQAFYELIQYRKLLGKEKIELLFLRTR